MSSSLGSHLAFPFPLSRLNRLDSRLAGVRGIVLNQKISGAVYVRFQHFTVKCNEFNVGYYITYLVLFLGGDFLLFDELLLVIEVFGDRRSKPFSEF